MRFAVRLAILACLPIHAGTLKVRIKSTVVEMPLERYVAAVLAGECSTFRNDEAVMAMAVAARTYGLRLRGRHAAEGFDLCSTTHCQRVETGAITPRLDALASRTEGEILWYEGKPAFACYSRSCGGHTEDGRALWPDVPAPYLTSHADPYCTQRPDVHWHWAANGAELVRALEQSRLRTPREITSIAIVERSVSGRAAILSLSGSGGPVRVSASSFRFAIGRALGFHTIQSDLWQVAREGDRLAFSGSGDGHGAGLCQLGADRMAELGRTWREILAFYYPGTAPGLTARGLHWTRLGGELLALMTTQPERDGHLLEFAERSLKASATRLGWPAPPGVEIRVYPDLDSFRNATGEPGWVAARTDGRRIHLQPTARLRGRGDLQSTLRHELFHVLVESRATPGLPVWFREGLVGYLSEQPRVSGAAVSDVDLQQTSDARRARAAYAAATRRVASLVARHGLPSVIGWLTAGLPASIAQDTGRK
jgi:stage II sporulation protein D